MGPALCDSAYFNRVVAGYPPPVSRYQTDSVFKKATGEFVANPVGGNSSLPELQSVAVRKASLGLTKVWELASSDRE